MNMNVFLWIIWFLLSACSNDGYTFQEDEPHIIADITATVNGHSSVTIDAILQIGQPDDISYYKLTCADQQPGIWEKESRSVEWLEDNQVQALDSNGQSVPHHLIFHPVDRSFVLWFWDLPEDGFLHLTYTFSEVSDPDKERYISHEAYLKHRNPNRRFTWGYHSTVPFAQITLNSKSLENYQTSWDGKFLRDLEIPLSTIGPEVEVKSRDTQDGLQLYILIALGVTAILLSILPIANRSKLILYSSAVLLSHIYWNWTWFLFHRYLFDSYTSYLGICSLLLALIAITIRACQYDIKVSEHFYRPINLFVIYTTIPLFVGYMIDDQQMMLSSVLGLGLFFLWIRRDTAIQFGVGFEKLVTIVHTQRVISFQELAKMYRVKEHSLLLGIANHAEGRVCVDYSEKIVYSMQHLASLQERHFCISCGGVTKESGQEKRVCPYCDRVYATPLDAKDFDQNPPTVSIISDFFFSFSVTSLYALVPILVFIGCMVFVKDVSDIIPFVLYIAGPAIPAFVLGLYVLDNFQLYRLVALIFWPLLKMLPGELSPFGPRELRHFRRNNGNLGQEIQKRGEMSLQDVVEFYGTTQTAAYEMMMFAAVDDDFDAVYDRLNDRLVSRQMYRNLDNLSSCPQCGGVLGIISGVVQCHHCGHSHAIS